MTIKATRPLFVNADRYGGAYSGAMFTAWIGKPPKEIKGDDVKCLEFWQHASGSLGKRLHGKGKTSEEAIKDLATKRSRKQ
jgi:hypothetical protein